MSNKINVKSEQRGRSKKESENAINNTKQKIRQARKTNRRTSFKKNQVARSGRPDRRPVECSAGSKSPTTRWKQSGRTTRWVAATSRLERREKAAA